MNYKAAVIFLTLILGSISWMDLHATGKTKSYTETEKIEYLISSVEKLGDAMFYRNGTWYDAKSAAEHLRMKLRKAGSSVKTADDFIEKIASRSYMTGVSYRIRFKDGREIDVNVFLRKRLLEFENR